MTRQPPATFEPLKNGDTIGIFAPASHFDLLRFEAGLDVLKQMGFKVKVPSRIFAKDGIFAGDDALRAELLNQLATDMEVSALMTARGGYGSQRMVDLIDFRAMSKARKPVIGFSDVTVVLWAAWVEAGLAGIHGPTVTTLAEADQYQRRLFELLLRGKREFVIEKTEDRPCLPGLARGPVVGGNLTSLCHLLGTRHAPRFSGMIVVLEDCGEKAYRVDRMVFQMFRAGCFDGLAGLALGRFSGSDDEQAVDRIFMELAGRLKVPLLAGLPVGHQGPNLPFVYGGFAVMDSAKGTLAFSRPGS